MKDSENPSPDVSDTPALLDEAQSESLRALLRGADEGDAPPVPDVLSGVQRKLRERSRGKYYADAWSTARQPPIFTYLVTSLVMLAVMLVAYLFLRPLSGEPRPVEAPPPVNVLPPQ